MSLVSKALRILTVVGLAIATVLGATTLAGPAPAEAAATEFMIVGQPSNKCIDIRAQDNDYGARAQLYSCHGKANQRFLFQRVGTTNAGDPYYRIISLSRSHLCLQVRDASQAHYAQIDVRGCSADAHQYWFQGGGGSGNSKPLRNLNSNQCLTVDSNADRARMFQYPCTSQAPTQMWRTTSK